MQHQVLADQAAGIGQSVGKPRRCRVQQKPRRADAVAGDDDHFGWLEPLDPVGIVIDRARGHALRVGGDFPHPAARTQFYPGADGVRPVGDIDAGFRALRAPRRAVAKVDAGRAPVIFGGCYGGIRWPPVPAEAVHGLGIAGAGLAEGQWRHGRLVRRVGRIAGQAGHAGHAVVLGKKRLQGRIIDRPVVGDAIQRLHPEIGWVHARIMGRVHDRAAANGVEIGDLHHGVVVVDRIICVTRPPVRADIEIAITPSFPVPPVAGEVGLLHPIPLFQTQDTHFGLGQAPRHCGA